jgi:peptidoglycan hydrolase CwlO-like protein
LLPATTLQIATLQAVNQQLKARASSLAGLQVEAGQLQPQVDKVNHLEEVLAKLRSKAAKLPGLQEEAEALRGPVIQVSRSLTCLALTHVALKVNDMHRCLIWDWPSCCMNSVLRERFVLLMSASTSSRWLLPVLNAPAVTCCYKQSSQRACATVQAQALKKEVHEAKALQAAVPSLQKEQAQLQAALAAAQQLRSNVAALQQQVSQLPGLQMQQNHLEQQLQELKQVEAKVARLKKEVRPVCCWCNEYQVV